MTQTELLDTIRAEIDRRREANKRQYILSGEGWQQMCDIEDCLVDLLPFLDALEQSIKPLTVEDVVEQGKRFGREVEIINHDEVALQEPEVDLEEEARKYLMKNFTPPGDKESFLIEDAAYALWFDDVCHLARHFAEWGAKNAK